MFAICAGDITLKNVVLKDSALVSLLYITMLLSLVLCFKVDFSGETVYLSF